MYESAFAATLAALALSITGCAAAQLAPPPFGPAVAPPMPTKIGAWDEQIDNDKGVVFSVATPKWATNYDGRPALQVTTTATNNGPTELSNVGTAEFATDRGPAGLQVGPYDKAQDVLTVLPGDTVTENRFLTVPEGAKTLRVTMAQGMSTAGGLGDQLVMNLHFRGDIPAPTAPITEDETTTTVPAESGTATSEESESRPPCDERNLPTMDYDTMVMCGYASGDETLPPGYHDQQPSTVPPDCTGAADGSTYCVGGSAEENESAEQQGDAEYREFCQQQTDMPQMCRQLGY